MCDGDASSTQQIINEAPFVLYDAGARFCGGTAWPGVRLINGTRLNKLTLARHHKRDERLITDLVQPKSDGKIEFLEPFKKIYAHQLCACGDKKVYFYIFVF